MGANRMNDKKDKNEYQLQRDAEHMQQALQQRETLSDFLQRGTLLWAQRHGHKLPLDHEQMKDVEVDLETYKDWLSGDKEPQLKVVK